MPELAAAGANPGHHDLIAEVHAFTAVLRRRWHLVAACVAVALALSVLYLARTRRLYEATTRVLVLQQGGRPLNVGGGNDMKLATEGADDLLATHSMIVSSPKVVGRAIQAVTLERLPTIAAERDPVDAAIESLKVSRPDRLARILEIRYRAGSPAEAVRLVEAVTESYGRFLEDSFQKNSGEVITLIKRARDELGRELEGLEKEYLEFRDKSPNLLLGKTGDALITNRLEHWDRSGSDFAVKEIQLRTQLELGRKLAKEGAELWAIAHAITQMGGNSDSLSATLANRPWQTGTIDYIRQLETEQQQLAERHGPGFSKVAEIQQTVARVRERAREGRNRLEEGEVRDLLRATEQGLASVVAMRAEVAKRLEDDRGEAKRVETDLLADENLRGNLDRHRALFNTVVDQLKQAQFVGDFDNISAETIMPAVARPGPVHPRVGLTLAVGLLAGCMLGGATAAVADRLDQRIRSLRDLKRVLDLPILGHVPLVRDERGIVAGEFGLVCHATPRSPSAEAYRAVRTNVEFLRRNKRIQVLMISSPHSGDGKSASASNLAISLACGGRRVLLVDGDLRRPSQHRIHGQPQIPGLTHYLRDLLPLERVVRPTVVAGLDLIAAGSQVANPAELLMSARFGRFLEEVRAAYDLIVVDSSPLLAVTDPSLIGAAADGVLLVARIENLRHHEAEQTLESLKGLDIPILGMLVNRATADQTGYGYGTYGSDADPAAAEGPGERGDPMSDAPADAQPHANGQATH